MNHNEGNVNSRQNKQSDNSDARRQQKALNHLPRMHGKSIPPITGRNQSRVSGLGNSSRTTLGESLRNQRVLECWFVDRFVDTVPHALREGHWQSWVNTKARRLNEGHGEHPNVFVKLHSTAMSFVLTPGLGYFFNPSSYIDAYERYCFTASRG